jgi:hypothetical protein
LLHWDQPEIVALLGVLLNIPLESWEKRGLHSILDWFVRNWTIICPSLPGITLTRPDGMVVEMDMGNETPDLTIIRSSDHFNSHFSVPLFFFTSSHAGQKTIQKMSVDRVIGVRQFSF